MPFLFYIYYFLKKNEVVGENETIKHETNADDMLSKCQDNIPGTVLRQVKCGQNVAMNESLTRVISIHERAFHFHSNPQNDEIWPASNAWF